MKNKVVLTYYDVENKIAEESLWIEKLENENYQIKNIPFFAPNIAYNDIITVQEEDGIKYFDKIVKASEHSTIQIVFFQNEFIKQTLTDLESLDCSWEGINEQQYITIDVPSSVNYKIVKEHLDKYFENNILDYKEACLSKTHTKNL